MPTAHTTLLLGLVLVTTAYLTFWARTVLAARAGGRVVPAAPNPLQIAIGFVTNFFDTLGIGSYAVTTSMYKLWKVVPDEKIPGTMNVGHTPATVVQALIYISIVTVDFRTLVGLIGAAVAGAYLGAGVVSRLPRRAIQIGMGVALLGAASLMLMAQLQLVPGGGEALALSNTKLAIGMGVNFTLGALMTLGIGLYAPCMIMISLLGMNPTAAFPIMMGSCAFLMPVGSIQFIRKEAYTLSAAIGLFTGGIPAVLIAAFIVKSLPLEAVRWLVVVVVVYTATAMLRSALAERRRSAGAAIETVVQTALGGLFAAGVVGTLMRPAVEGLAQVPVSLVLTRGAGAADPLMRAAAVTSFNYVAAWALGGLVVGAVAGCVLQLRRPRQQELTIGN